MKKEEEKMNNEPARLEAAWDGKIPCNTPDKEVPTTSTE